MFYKPINVEVNYTYKPQSNIESIIAKNKNNNDDIIFSESLEYNKSNDFISHIYSKQNTNPNSINDYFDSEYRFRYSEEKLELINFSGKITKYENIDITQINECYVYDEIGNRLNNNNCANPFYSQNRTLNEEFNYLNNTSNRLIRYKGNKYSMNNSCWINNILAKYEYYDDGSLKTRYESKFIPDPGQFVQTGWWQSQSSSFTYDYRGLLHSLSYRTTMSQDTCLIPVTSENCKELEYSYNPMSEREQKRMINAPGADNNGGTYPWIYYLLGADNKQHSVFYGMQVSDASIPTKTTNFINPYTYPNKYNINNNEKSSSIVFMYPAEYNTYGAGSSINITRRLQPLNANINDLYWTKHFNITDHLGNVRAVLQKRNIDDLNTEYNITNQYEYGPWGNVIWQKDVKSNNRTKFIGKETDNESGDHNHGVRQYSDYIGRFLCVDPLWDQQYSYSPYYYSANNPISNKDPNGDIWDTVLDFIFIGYDLYDIGKSVVNGQSVTTSQYTALGGDVLGAVIPFMTGGGTVAKALSKADDAAKATNKVVNSEKKANTVLTNKQSNSIAKELGFGNKLSSNKIPKNIKSKTGENPVYYDKKTRKYYSPDKGGHRADNAWKQFDSDGNRETGVFIDGQFKKVSD